jgi:hypothetical protein
MDELLNAYRQGVADLGDVLKTVADVDARRSADEWSTRMIVHHLADGEALWLQPLKLALLQNGFVYHHNVWLQEGSGEALAYATRDIAPSLALFRCQREHAAELLAAVPNAFERHIMFRWDGNERRVTVEDIVKMQIRHLEGHLAEVDSNRQPKPPAHN